MTINYIPFSAKNVLGTASQHFSINVRYSGANSSKFWDALQDLLIESWFDSSSSGNAIFFLSNRLFLFEWRNLPLLWVHRRIGLQARMVHTTKFWLSKLFLFLFRCQDGFAGQRCQFKKAHIQLPFVESDNLIEVKVWAKIWNVFSFRWGLWALRPWHQPPRSLRGLAEAPGHGRNDQGRLWQLAKNWGRDRGHQGSQGARGDSTVQIFRAQKRKSQAISTFRISSFNEVKF